jgi:hypothetical protein
MFFWRLAMSSTIILMIIFELIKFVNRLPTFEANNGLLLVCLLQVLVILFLVIKISFDKNKGGE